MRRTDYPGVYAYETRAGTRFAASFRDSTGRQSFRRGFTSPREANRARAELLTRASAGRLRVSREKFSDFFAGWLATRRPYLEPGTQSDYEIHGRKRLLPAFGARRLTALDAPLIEEWLSAAGERGDCSPKTLNNSLAVLVACLNDAVRKGLLPGNPASTVRRLPLSHREMDYLRLQEIPEYLDAANGIYRPLAEVLIGAGVRISEALALKWADVDLEAAALRVYRSAKRTGEGSTKGNRFRAVQIAPRVVTRLGDLRAQQGELSMDDTLARYVFVMPRRRRKTERGRWEHPEVAVMSRGTVSGDWHKQTLRDAGLRDMPLHALRHSAAAAWLSTGRSLVFVQRQLGHSSITTTERVYGHLEQRFLSNEAAATEAAIWRGASDDVRPHHAG
jgi:integrase